MRGNLFQRLICCHPDEKLAVETSGNRMFTRCMCCGKTSGGIETGELAITQLLPSAHYEARVDAFLEAIQISGRIDDIRRVA